LATLSHWHNSAQIIGRLVVIVIAQFTEFTPEKFHILMFNVYVV